jgi:hypothetical protein
MNRAALKKAPDDVEAAGYPAVRQAFNEVLQACVAKLTEADWDLAAELLEIEGACEDERYDQLIVDTALFSRPGAPIFRAHRKRAIDRLARKLPVKRDPLKASLAEQLPAAFFSAFEAKEVQPDGSVFALDVLDENRPVCVMDASLAQSITPGTLFAGRFIDVGPWHIGFGVIIPLRKSEALALALAMSHEGDLSEKRDSLHEIVYFCHIHRSNLVTEALEPLILALSFAIDHDEGDFGDLVGQFRSALLQPDPS